MFSRRPRLHSGPRVPASPASPPLSVESLADAENAGNSVKKAVSHTRIFGHTFISRSDSLSENSKRSLSRSRHDRPQDKRSLASLKKGRAQSPRRPGKTLHQQGNQSISDAGHLSNGVKVVRQVSSLETLQSSHKASLPGLQARYLKDTHDYEPLRLADLGPDSFDLVPSNDHGNQGLGPSMLEQRFDTIFSDFHLHIILQDYSTLQRFTEFITSYRPKSLPLLRYYLGLMKAQAAMHLTNSIIHDLKPVSYHGVNLKFTENPAGFVESQDLHDKISRAFHTLARDDLSAYITHQWMHIVETSMRQRVTGLLPSHLKDLSEGLAETFCLTDPSKPDNPIVFASEEFHRTTEYGTSYAIGRNCRFLQGPKTDQSAVRRLKMKLDAGQEHSEVLLNYRRDGSPFMQVSENTTLLHSLEFCVLARTDWNADSNLLMCAPLKDFRGNVRYFLGAQVDVSGLASEFTGVEYLKDAAVEVKPSHKGENSNASNGIQDAVDSPLMYLKKFSEMLSDAELKVVREHGGRMHRPDLGRLTVRDRRRLVIVPEHGEQIESDQTSVLSHRPSTSGAGDESSSSSASLSIATISGGYLGRVYEHYVLVRPAPSLRILFASPSLRIPGLLQSCLLDRIGGPARVREQVIEAVVQGQSVTANILWITKPTSGHNGVEKGIGRARWLHATPLLSASGAVGVWMVVLVDDESERTKTMQGHAADDAPIFMPNKRHAPTIKPPTANQTFDEAVDFDYWSADTINSKHMW
ncbi:hypothetical protein N0V93_004866 [Gnomoniopsis smithogilvyi]|uniref:PAS domain-containing protein n=1 Tax=Gnomoniopsis smithogilvyi TaxID=1191159 RepID=A0A9W9CXI9_9PEZI|nr:hypothetical protein N0V93_004866 [Gnomoniopsis smithogilvyi]